jgi:hypothetical protein
MTQSNHAFHTQECLNGSRIRLAFWMVFLFVGWLVGSFVRSFVRWINFQYITYVGHKRHTARPVYHYGSGKVDRRVELEVSTGPIMHQSTAQRTPTPNAQSVPTALLRPRLRHQWRLRARFCSLEYGLPIR